MKFLAGLQRLSIATPLIITCFVSSVSSVASAQKVSESLEQRIEAFASTLVAASTDRERKALLRGNREAVSSDLWQFLIKQTRLLIQQGKYAEALKTANSALSFAEHSGDKKSQILALQLVGSTYLRQENYREAFASFQNGLQLSEELKDKGPMTYLSVFSGAAQLSLGEYAESLKNSETGLLLAKEVGRKELSLQALLNLGNAHYLLGNYSKALSYFQELLTNLEATQSPNDVASVLSNIGSIFAAQGNYEHAVSYYQRSLKAVEGTKDKDATALTLNNLGVIHYLRGDYSQALEHLRSSLKFSENTNKERTALALNNIGIVYLEQGETEQALEYSRRSLSLAEQIGEKERITEALNNIARTLIKAKKYEQAVGVAERAAGIAQQIRNSERLWEGLTTLGRGYLLTSQPHKAQESFLKAIDVIENLRNQVAGDDLEKQAIFEKKLTPYHAMMSLSIGNGELTKALTYAEKAKGRVLLDVLRRGGRATNIAKAMTTPEQAEERQLNGEIVRLNKQLSDESLKVKSDQSRINEIEEKLQKARLVHEGFLTNLYAAHPQLKAQRGEVSPINAEQLVNVPFSEDFAALEYVITEEKSYVFVITRRGPLSAVKDDQIDLRVYQLAIESQDLTRLVSAFREQVANRQVTPGSVSRELYELLLKPAEKQIAGKKTLCIVPDGVLWLVPFQALQNGAKFLISDHEVFYAPSLSVLREMTRGTELRRRRRPEENGRSFFALANPSIDKAAAEKSDPRLRGKRWEPLPEASNEVLNSAKLYGAGRTKVYTEEDALEERIKTEAAPYSVVHFATHAWLNDVNPMYSYLQLARREHGQEDGLLEAREILDLDFRADLAVLSACETGTGKIRPGEGVIGLSWAFAVAGVPSTVASFWSVESKSTSQLMVEFHRQLVSTKRRKRGGLAKAAALRRSQLKLLASEEFNHPYYWAGFNLVGDPR